MSEHWHPSREPAEQESGVTPEPTPAWGTAPADPGGPPTAPTPPTAAYPPTPPADAPPVPPAGTGVPIPPGGHWATPQDAGLGGPPPIALPPSGGWGTGAWAAPGGGSLPPGGAWPPPPYGYLPPPPPPSAKPAGRSRSGALVGVATLVAAVALLAGAGIGHLAWPTDTTTSAVANPASGGTGTTPLSPGSGGTSPFGSGSGGNSSTGVGAPADISAIAGKADPGLVDINTNLSYQDEQAAGTGMVLTSSGEVLTNNHVIDGATSISATDVGNGRTYKATVVGYDRTGDVAVIQLIGASGLQTVTPNTGAVSVGESVVGVGNAGGTGGTPSAAGGSVTATDQSITASDDSGGNTERLSGLVEINAGIQPGDSGGALVNTSGQVIGMDTAASTGTAYQVTTAQAYAIPISTAVTLARQIEAGRQTATVHIGATGFLGIRVEASGSSATGGLGSGLGGSSANGAVVDSALAGSPGALAGLSQGDVITSLNGSAVNSSSDLTNLLESHHPGDSVQIGWTDPSGQTHTSTAVLTTGPPA